jgi:hypothetical protein
MAKLSARNRTELLRVEKPLPDGEYFINMKRTYAFMSDGNLLVKETAKQKPDNLYPKGKHQVWNWTVFKKYKKESIEKVLVLLKDNFIKHGYTVIFERPTQ